MQKKKTKVTKINGYELKDDYFWLRDKKNPEVKEPSDYTTYVSRSSKVIIGTGGANSVKPMGMDLEIIESKGPIFDKPLRSAADIESLETDNLIKRLDYVFQAIKNDERKS